MLQGIGDSLVLTPSNYPLFYLTFDIVYSIITLEFADDAEKYMGFSQMALALGLVAGPILGSYFYQWGGYGCVMNMISLMMLCGTVFACVMIEKDEYPEDAELLFTSLKEPLLNDKDKKRNGSIIEEVDEESEADSQQLGYWSIMSI